MITAKQINNDMMGKTRKTKEPMLTGREIKKYTVWVDEQEITTGFITYTAAKMLDNIYRERGINNVVIREGR